MPSTAHAPKLCPAVPWKVTATRSCVPSPPSGRWWRGAAGEGRVSPPLLPPPPPFAPYTHEPPHTLPYIPRPDAGAGWQTWLEQDQRFVDNRPDVLTWESEPLKEDLTNAGDVTAHLFASTTGPDDDWRVKRIDVYPDPVTAQPPTGGAALVGNGVSTRRPYGQPVADPG